MFLVVFFYAIFLEVSILIFFYFGLQKKMQLFSVLPMYSVNLVSNLAFNKLFTLYCYGFRALRDLGKPAEKVP